MDTYLEIPDHALLSVPPTARALFVAPAAATAEEIETLDNIIKACGLTQGMDCATLRIDAGTSLASAPLPALTDHLVCFGFDPLEIGLGAAVQPYVWTPPLGGRRYCFAERLAVIAADLELKKRLWASIKSLKVVAAKPA